MQILDAWFRDLPQQFHGLPKIEVLISAFAKQLQEVEQVLEDLTGKTDLKTAAGRNLDYIGTIIPLTRKEAGILAGTNDPEYVMSDDRYRKFLLYKLLENTNSCTYYDIIEGLALLWDVPAYYVEDPEQPATIILDVPLLKLVGGTVPLGAVPMVKPAGVGIYFRYHVKVLCEVGFSRTHYIFAYDITGTKPEKALLGVLGGISAVTETNSSSFLREYDRPAMVDAEVGRGPVEKALLGRIVNLPSETAANTENFPADIPGVGEVATAGIYPGVSTLAELNVINSAASADVDSSPFTIPHPETDMATGRVDAGIAASALVRSGEYGFEILKTTNATGKTEVEVAASAIVGSNPVDFPAVNPSAVADSGLIAGKADASVAASAAIDSETVAFRASDPSAVVDSGMAFGKDTAAAGAGVEAESFRTKYVYCGTRRAQS